MLCVPALLSSAARPDPGSALVPDPTEISIGAEPPRLAESPSGSNFPFSPKGDPEKDKKWFEYQRALKAESAAYKAKSSGHGLVMFGDSLTERLVGTCMGGKQGHAIRDKLPEFANNTIRPEWHGVQMHGICGNTADDLLWRVTDGGELSHSMKEDPRLLFSVLIGTNGKLSPSLAPVMPIPPAAPHPTSAPRPTSPARPPTCADLGSNKTVKQTQSSVSEVAREILRHAKGRVLVNGLLARGSRTGGTPKGRDWAHDIHEVNSMLEESVQRLQEKFGVCRIAFAGCTEAILKEHRHSPEQEGTMLRRHLCDVNEDSDCVHEGVNITRVPDGVHPNEHGWRALYRDCLRPELNKLAECDDDGAAVPRVTSADAGAVGITLCPLCVRPKRTGHEDAAPNCCSPGAAWDGMCGKDGPYTWQDGYRACQEEFPGIAPIGSRGRESTLPS